VGASRRFIVRHGDEATPVDALDDGSVRVGGAGSVFTVTAVSPGCYHVADGVRAWRVTVAGPRESRYVGVDGISACVEVQPEGQPPVSRPRARHGGLAAPMPGTVLEIEVAVGQQVRAGDILLTLEAMKMELPIRAPQDGVVSAIHCARGDLVQPGPPLIEIT
jgi:biotin carboxyl carrier protein